VDSCGRGVRASVPPKQLTERYAVLWNKACETFELRAVYLGEPIPPDDSQVVQQRPLAEFLLGDQVEGPALVPDERLGDRQFATDCVSFQSIRRVMGLGHREQSPLLKAATTGSRGDPTA